MSTSDLLHFADLALAAPVQKAIKAVGYEQPSPIQAASIPHLLAGEDLLGIAQTGTGKTAAFALPLLSRIDLDKKSPQVLVLAPTRELAIQVAEAFKTYAAYMKGFHVLPIYGGQDMSGQLRQLKRGVHVVVGTPGRVMDHLRRKTLKLDALMSLVLDEADEMLRMGFIDDVEWILEHTPDERQTALFSATMPAPIRKVADRYLDKPQEVRIASKTATADQVEQSYLIVGGFEQKLDAITRILEAQTFDAVLVFVRTKTNTVELAEKLEARGYSASPMNGDMNQTLRERTINRLKKNQLDIIVATDVAARGIDVGRISHVINFDIPYDSEAYVHRIGRTGRAGRKGSAILFVAPREKRLLATIEKATRQTISRMELPSGREVSDKRIENFKQQLTDTINSQDLNYFYDILAEYSRDSDQSAEDIASALAYLLQRDRPLQVKDVPRKKKRKDRESRDDSGGDRRESRSRSTGKQRSAARNNDDVPMERYRLEVGLDHGVKPGDIVGAIANEVGLESQHIGHIRLHDDYSTVDLPEDMPKDILQHLRKVRVRQQPLQIKKEAGGSEPSEKKRSKRDGNTHPRAKNQKEQDRKPRKKKAAAKPAKSKAKSGGAKPAKKSTKRKAS